MSVTAPKSGFEADELEDMQRLNRLMNSHLIMTKHLERTLDPLVSRPGDVRDLLLLTSRGGKLKGYPWLKVMHIIHYRSRELLSTAHSNQRALFSGRRCVRSRRWR